MHQRAEEAGKALQSAMDDAHAKTSLTIDDLAIQADKLQLNIDKLKGHPGNGLQLGLDEAKKSADELLSSLTADRKEIEALFKETHVGSVDAWLSGSNPTGNQEASIKQRQADYIKRIQGIETDINGRYAGTTTDDQRKALDAERRRRIEQAMRQELASVAGERKDLVSGNTTIDVDPRTGQVSTNVTHQNDVRIGQLDAYAQQVRSQLALFQYRNKVADLITQEQTLKAGRNSEGFPNSAAEDQRREWETQLKEQQSNGDMTIAQEREFWLARLQVVQVGSVNYLFAYDRFLDATRKQAEQQRKQIEDLRKANAEAERQQRDELIKALTPGAVAQSKGIVNSIDSGRRLKDAETKAGYSSAESDIQFQLQTKQITQLDAAMQLQALHTAEYREQFAQLNEQLAAVKGSDENAEATRNGYRTQIVELNGRRASQVNQDRLATWDGSTSGIAGAKDALDQFVRSTRDAATQMRNITSSILNGINDQLANAMVGDHTDWGSTFKGIGKQVAKSGLERAEGSILGAFGFGKPDGTATNPLNVRVVDGSGVPGGIGGLFGGDDSDSDSRGGIGGLFSSIFGGARAAGGDVEAGKIYRFNENGQELFAPHTSGTVIPNNKLNFGGGDNISYSIDARGTDPVQTDMRVRAAIVAAHQSSVKQAVKQVHQQSARQPRRR
jgi:lambda family phage tail tape measure protein